MPAIWPFLANRAAKALEGALAEIKMDQFPRCPTRAVCGAYIALQVCYRWLWFSACLDLAAPCRMRAVCGAWTALHACGRRSWL